MEYKLPKDFAEKWIAALRSGEYKQGRGQLYNSKDGSYCCLGVACAINETTTIQMDGCCMPFKSNNHNITEELEGSNSGNYAETFVSMNDIFNKTFNEIANWIEENVTLY